MRCGIEIDLSDARLPATPARSFPGVRPAVLARFVAVALFLVSLAGGGAVAAENDRGLLWEVGSATGTVYLLGTIHVGTKSLYPLPAAIEGAFARSTALAVEADMTRQDALLAAAGSAMYEPPDNLERHVPASLYRDALDVLKGYGVPAEVGRGLKPHVLSMALTMFEVGRVGMDAALGLDVHLLQRAHRDGKRVIELESAAQQIDLLAGLPAEFQVAMLESTVRSIRDQSLANDMQEIVAAWKRGDAESMDEAATRDLDRMPASTSGPLRRTLYEDRNRAMADRIAALLSGRDTVMVAVGAGHLTGPTGLVALLRARGYQIHRR